MLGAILLTILMFIINPLLGVIVLLGFVVLGIYAWKTAETRQRSKNISRNRGVSPSGYKILKDMGKCVKDLGRPQYGRYGRSSIAKRKRRHR
jgi:hypothetical protein